ASRCAASNWPILSRSRTFDHDTSRTSSTSSPSSAVKPLSTATIRAVASARGMNPTRSGVRELRPVLGMVIAMSVSEKFVGADQALGHVGDALALAHGGLAQQGVGRRLVEPTGFHQDAFGLF